jgi:DNA-binding LacI/PurR family transcriptional regulator
MSALTQKDVVEKLNISRVTLSRVLNNSPLVKSSTRERVLEELKALNYEPNILAQGLKNKSTKTIGLVGPASIRISNIGKLNAIYEATQKQGYSIAMGYSNGTAEEDRDCIRKLRARMVDGLIVMGRGLKETIPIYQEVINRGIPMVSLFPLAGLAMDCVYVDTQDAYKRLTQYLISLGHEKIGLLINDSHSEFTLHREKGFRAAIKEADLALNENWIVYARPENATGKHDESSEIRLWGNADYAIGYIAMKKLLSRKNLPTASLCLSDEAAVGALKAADELGCRVPEDMALVGYNDDDLAPYARIPLTTMRQPHDLIGEGAVSLLIDRIENKLKKSAVIKPIPTSLVVRESCGAHLKA